MAEERPKLSRDSAPPPPPTIATVSRRLDEQIEQEAARYAQLQNYLSNHNHLLIQIIETLNQMIPHLVTLEANHAAVETHFGMLESKLKKPKPPAVPNELHYLAIVARAARAQAHRLKQAKGETKYARAKPKTFDAYLTMMEKLEPLTFPKWLPLMRAAEETYRVDPHGSCAVWGNTFAEGFRDFCSLYLTGRVLDIGMGPSELPLYLQGYPADLISAVEPLPMFAKVDFEVVRGFAEFLPWPDKSFDTVIASTSLDHVLSLDRSLSEVHRVMSPDGRFLVWIGSLEGSAPYQPSNPDLQPIDSFHLFHFDKSWFEPLLAPLFTMEERIVIPVEGFEHVFYCLAAK